MSYLISERDYSRLQNMLRWYERNKNLRDKYQRKGPVFGGDYIPPKIFEVQDKATGRGIYKCYEQKLVSANWNDATGADKFNNKYSAWSGATAYKIGDHVTHDSDNTQYKCILAHTNHEPPNATYWVAEAEIFNLNESDPADTNYEPALALYDRMITYRYNDDQHKSRCVGIPVGPTLRMVRIDEGTLPHTQIGGAGNTITCNLILNDGGQAETGELGYHIEVGGRATPSNIVIYWDDVIVPTLVGSQDYHFVYSKNGHWYFNEVFKLGILCLCET